MAETIFAVVFLGIFAAVGTLLLYLIVSVFEEGSRVKEFNRYTDEMLERHIKEARQEYERTMDNLRRMHRPDYDLDLTPDDYNEKPPTRRLGRKEAE